MKNYGFYQADLQGSKKPGRTPMQDTNNKEVSK